MPDEKEKRPPTSVAQAVGLFTVQELKGWIKEQGIRLNPAPKTREQLETAMIDAVSWEQFKGYALERHWSILRQRQEAERYKILRYSKNMGFSEAAFTVEEQRLKEKWGVDPSPNDTFKSMTEHAVLEAMKRNDFQRTAFLRGRQAWLCFERGEPHLLLQREESKFILLDRQKTEQLGIAAAVKIYGCADGCAPCRLNHGKIFSFKEALRALPIPNPACERGYCRCDWAIEILDERFKIDTSNMMDR